MPWLPSVYVPTQASIWYFLSDDAQRVVYPFCFPWGAGATVVVVVVLGGSVGAEVVSGVRAVVAGVGRTLTVGDGAGARVVIGTGALAVVATGAWVVVDVDTEGPLVVASTAVP